MNALVLRENAWTYHEIASCLKNHSQESLSLLRSWLLQVLAKRIEPAEPFGCLFEVGLVTKSHIPGK